MNIPEELLPVVEWWEKDGKQTVAVVAVVGLAVLGWQGWKGWKENRRLSASQALMTSATSDDFESALEKYGSTQSAASIRVCLAQKLYSAGRYEEALAEYEKLLPEGAAPDGFADVPVVGKAQCLEALGRLEEAKKAYSDFAEAKPKSYLALTATIGVARCVAQLGDKAKAVESLEAAKAALKDDDETAKKRWEKREKPASATDVADALKDAAEPKVSVVPSAPEAPAEPAAPGASEASATPEPPAAPAEPEAPAAPAAEPEAPAAPEATPAS